MQRITCMVFIFVTNKIIKYSNTLYKMTFNIITNLVVLAYICDVYTIYTIHASKSKATQIVIFTKQ